VNRDVPHDPEAEEAVIGACLLDRTAAVVATTTLTAADFYVPRHQVAFEVIATLLSANEPIDAVTVAAGIPDTTVDGAGPVAWLHSLSLATPSISAVHRYASIVLNHAKSRSLIFIGDDLQRAGYERQPAADVAARYADLLSDHELLRRHEAGPIRGFHDDIGMLDTGESRDDAQPWIARGVLRRGQRLLVVAKAGIGKSTLLRQLAFCAVNGVHPWTGQPTERPRRALIVELEAGAWDIVASMRDIMLALRRCRDVATTVELARPALLHRPGGLDIRTPAGLSTFEAAIQRAQPQLVVAGPVKYLSSIHPGENYETAALGVHATLNELSSRYGFAVALEAHFSRGDHGAPGGSERWVDWPDVGFGVHPPEQGSLATEGLAMDVKPFRIPRDGDIFLPSNLRRNAPRNLPWSVEDWHDPVKYNRSVFAERYGGTRQVDYVAHQQHEL
jgi:hypothetical protein